MIPRFNTATPGALMFVGGMMLVYWALSQWKLFGLGNSESVNG